MLCNDLRLLVVRPSARSAGSHLRKAQGQLSSCLPATHRQP